jgi:DNA (cytosine-5)-methyltransferase 1
MKKYKIGGQFSGVGAFDFALDRLGIKYENVYQAEWDKYARQTYLHNHCEPEYYVKDVNDTPIKEITDKHGSLDIAMFSPPCQAFSLAGKRKGEDDKRGVLFYNSHEFIFKNKPRYFIFENVKGLLSDAKGRTFQIWIDFLGGKSVNGNPVIFPADEAVPYHVYYQVLNAKNYGVPQNRERVFIIGIRDDVDNDFSFPKPFPLEKRLKDVLESEVDEKYFLSDKMIAGLINNQKFRKFNPTGGENESSCITSRVHKMGNADNYIDVKKIGYINQDTQASQVISENGIMPNVCAGTHGYALGYVETKIGAIRGRNPSNPLSIVSGLPTEQMLEINENGTSNALTTVQKDNVVCTPIISNYRSDNPINSDNKVFSTLRANAGAPLGGVGIYHKYKIRRLTPRECFRLMDFPDSFTWPVSNSQAYKQAGNSIVVNVLSEIIKKLNLKNEKKKNKQRIF